MSAPSTIVAQACCPVLPCLFVRANLILQQQGAHDAAHILLSHWSFIRRMFVFLFAKNRTMLGELTDQQMDELLKKAGNRAPWLSCRWTYLRGAGKLYLRRQTHLCAFSRGYEGEPYA